MRCESQQRSKNLKWLDDLLLLLLLYMFGEPMEYDNVKVV
jgi:hypothetical protein